MVSTTNGPQRTVLEPDDVAALTESGALVIDERRRRPLYFDGRFLAARDLTRDQNYVLTRQADLGRAGGAGVVQGLMVTAVAGAATSLRLQAGHGVAPAGEVVVVPNDRTIDLGNVPEIQRLDAAFGLLRLPRDVPRNRTGLFVVALRPVEFSANPIAAYPTSITGPRTVEDGDIVEAVVVALIPFPDDGTSMELTERRRHLAREIFVEAGGRAQARRGALPVDVLPLAMIALRRGIVEWVDPFLVRREVGAEHADILGLGLAPRALREAHLLQYDFHLQEVLRQRDAHGRGRRFPAAEHFDALPPAGRLPAGAIDPGDFTQVYFPAGIDVDLSIVPADELPALLEESLTLPPIDLTLPAEQLESTAVLVLIPVPRFDVAGLKHRLSSLTRRLRLAAPGLVASRLPLETLRGLRLSRLTPPPLLRPEDLVDAAWRQQLSTVDQLWYVRCRNLHTKAEVVGRVVAVDSDEVLVERAVDTRIRAAGLVRNLAAIRRRATTPARAEIVALLGEEKFGRSPTVLTAAVRELQEIQPEPPAEGAAPSLLLRRETVLDVRERFADPRLGEGMARLEAANPALRSDPAIVEALVQSGRVLELDQLARATTATELPALATAVEAAARQDTPEALDALIGERR